MSNCIDPYIPHQHLHSSNIILMWKRNQIFSTAHHHCGSGLKLQHSIIQCMDRSCWPTLQTDCLVYDFTPSMTQYPDWVSMHMILTQRWPEWVRSQIHAACDSSHSSCECKLITTADSVANQPSHHSNQQSIRQRVQPHVWPIGGFDCVGMHMNIGDQAAFGIEYLQDHIVHWSSSNCYYMSILWINGRQGGSRSFVKC